MIDKLTIISELNKFAQIDFNKELHQYSLGSSSLTSVTKLLSNFKKPFEAEYWAKLKAQETGKDFSQIIAEWNAKRDTAQLRGSNFHRYIESRLNNINLEQNSEADSNLLDCEHLKLLRPLADKFCCDIEGKMEPIVSEFIIGNVNLGVAGTIDQLFFNYKSRQLEIWDWKTNANFNLNSRYRLINGLEHLEDCELILYSLQLQLYRRILSDTTSLQIGNCYLAWFNEKNLNYKIYRALDLSKEVDLILKTSS